MNRVANYTVKNSIILFYTTYFLLLNKSIQNTVFSIKMPNIYFNFSFDYGEAYMKLIEF